MGQALQISVITIFYDEAEKSVGAGTVPAPENRKAPVAKRVSGRKKRENEFEQGMLNLTNYTKGLFVNTVPVMHGDDDLDIPTFQRRGIPIDKGPSSK